MIKLTSGQQSGWVDNSDMFIMVKALSTFTFFGHGW